MLENDVVAVKVTNKNVVFQEIAAQIGEMGAKLLRFLGMVCEIVIEGFGSLTIFIFDILVEMAGAEAGLAGTQIITNIS